MQRQKQQTFYPESVFNYSLIFVLRKFSTNKNAKVPLKVNFKRI